MERLSSLPATGPQLYRESITWFHSAGCNKIGAMLCHGMLLFSTQTCVLDIHVGGAWESKSRYGLDRMLK